MPDVITKTTGTSWFSRVGSAFAGVIIGLILIVGCVGGLFWNEGRAVNTERGLSEGAGLVVEAPADPIDPANDQKLVHVTGMVAVVEPLSDPAFGITATGVSLARNVEMYQWQEESKSESRTKLGGGEETVTTYTYTKVWSAQALDSSGFESPAGHENPAFAVESTRIVAEDATLGAFRLDEAVLNQMDGGQPVPLSDEDLVAVQAAMDDTAAITISANQIVIAENPTVPVVGDVRIGYEITPATQTSVVALQNGDGFMPYRTSNGEELLLVSGGDVPASEMFQGAQDANAALTWIIRLVGMVLLMVGFGMVLAPLGVLADVLPLAGTIVRMGTGLIGFVLGMLVGTVAIAVAWLAFRPLLTVAILIIGGIIAFAVYSFGRGRARKKLAEEAAA
jgi:hypothetical protein